MDHRPSAPAADLPGVPARALAALTLARTAVNVSRRFAYPFVPALARVLGAPVGAVQGVVALQGATGMLAPLFGPWIERWGRRRTMIGSLALMAGAGFAGGLVGSFVAFAVVLGLWGLGKVVHDPAQQAWVGDRTPYARRAMVMGITEVSWSASLLVSAPVLGWLLARGDARWVLIVIAAGLAGGAALVAFCVPSDPVAGHGAPPSRSPLAAWRSLAPPARAAVLYSFLLVVANEVFFIDLGVWLERTHGLGLAGLGVAAAVIGGAEVVGEGLVIGLADRVGKRRAVLGGTLLSAAAYAATPAFGSGSPVAALALVFAAFVGVEVAFVASFPLITTLAPGSRAVLMSANFGAHATGRVSGALLGGALLAVTGSFGAVTVVCLWVGIGAAGVLWTRVPESQEPNLTPRGRK